ncbi:MAG: MarR family transcriptional regulator [Chloroflexi bacterium]|nr:MarR family transcriptional regulator [Chloroflexota bacterium]
MGENKTQLISEVVDLHRRVKRALGQYTPEAWMDLNLTIAQLKSLLYIASEGSTNSRKLAAALRVTPSNVTGIVDRLVEQGLVSRQENPEDRRAILLRATEEGGEILADLREKRSNYLSEVLDCLSAVDLAAVARGLALLADAAERYDREGQHAADRG